LNSRIIVNVISWIRGAVHYYNNISIINMWKPWILIALGSALIADAAARGFAPADSIAAYNAKHDV
jgi:hypothetical protein